MPEWDGKDGSAASRFAISLLIFGALAIAAIVAVSASGVRMPLRAEAAEQFDGPWGFAKSATDALNASALQICAAEGLAKAAESSPNADIRKEQMGLLAIEYGVAAQAYNQRVRDNVALGYRRPWEVAATALPLNSAKERVCLKVATAPVVAPAIQRATNIARGASGRFITLEQLDAYAVIAGWPQGEGWWPEMRKIVLCETGSLDLFAHNTSDPLGGSYGLAQLNGRQHFEKSGEDFEKRFDPVVNLRTALWLRTVRGHFGGSGGWKVCSERWGIE